MNGEIVSRLCNHLDRHVSVQTLQDEEIQANTKLKTLLLATVVAQHVRSLLDFKSIRMTPRRGRGKHGLVGPVYCFARTADEMLPVGPSRVAESLRKATKAHRGLRPDATGVPRISPEAQPRFFILP